MEPSSTSADESELRVACDGCRALHRACDGETPSCRQCLRRKIACVRSTRNKPGPKRAPSGGHGAVGAGAGGASGGLAYPSQNELRRLAAGGAGDAAALPPLDRARQWVVVAPATAGRHKRGRTQPRGSGGGRAGGTKAAKPARAGRSRRDNADGDDDDDDDVDERDQPGSAGSPASSASGSWATMDSADPVSPGSSEPSSPAPPWSSAAPRLAGAAAARLNLPTHLLESDRMNSYHELYRATIGSVIRPFDIASLAAALRINADLGNEQELSRKLFAFAIVSFGARITGDKASSAEAARRAVDLSGQWLRTSRHPFVAAANLLLGSVTSMDDQVPMSMAFSKRAYLASRRPAGAPPTVARDVALDTVHLLTGARLFGLAANVKESFAVLNECRGLDQANHAGHVFFRYHVVRKYVFEAFRRDATGERITRRLVGEIRRLLLSLAQATSSLIHSGHPISLQMIRNVCQNYLAVEALVHLLSGDREAARRTAHTILRFTYDFPGDSTTAPNVHALAAALKVFMDLGMPAEVQQCMQALDLVVSIFGLAGKLLRYARTGERPIELELVEDDAATTHDVATATAAATAANRQHNADLILLDSSFKRAARAVPQATGLRAAGHRSGPALSGYYDDDDGGDEDDDDEAVGDGAGRLAFVDDDADANTIIVSLENMVDWALILRQRAPHAVCVSPVDLRAFVPQAHWPDGTAPVSMQAWAPASTPTLAELHTAGATTDDADAVGVDDPAGSRWPGASPELGNSGGSGSSSGVWLEPLWAMDGSRSPGSLFHLGGNASPGPGSPFARDFSPAPASFDATVSSFAETVWPGSLRRRPSDGPWPS